MDSFRHLPVLSLEDCTHNWEQLQSELQTATAAASAENQDTGWKAPTLLNSWTAVAGRIAVGYRRQGNMVRLRGSIEGGASGKTVFVLPGEFSPTGATECVGSRGGEAGKTAVVIQTNGEIIPFFSGGTFSSLDGITFTTD